MTPRYKTTALLLVLVVTTGLMYWWTIPKDVLSSMYRGDYRRAAVFLHDREVRAEPGRDAVALTTLANLYFLGLGVDQDYREASRLYSKAAFAGDTAAQVNLGHIYSNGQGVHKDNMLAYAWYNLAHTNGRLIAQSYMSELLSEYKLNPHIVNQLQSQYVTVQNFPKLH